MLVALKKNWVGRKTRMMKDRMGGKYRSSFPQICIYVSIGLRKRERGKHQCISFD